VSLSQRRQPAGFEIHRYHQVEQPSILLCSVVHGRRHRRGVLYAYPV